MLKDLDPIMIRSIAYRVSFFLIYLTLNCSIVSAQISIGNNNPEPSAALEVHSMDKGFLPPRMTKAQMEVISSPVEGLMVFCTDCVPTGLYVYVDSAFNFINAARPVQITTLECGEIELSSNIFSEFSVRGVSFSLPYTGGNNTKYEEISITSSGVDGLVATLKPGVVFESGGNLEFLLSGTPMQSGTATFEVSFGGQTCSVEIPVIPTSLTALDCSQKNIEGSYVLNEPITNGVLSIDYTGGNGGPYKEIIYNSTGVTGITATLLAGNLSEENGSLQFILSGTPESFGTASFEIQVFGQQCIVNIEIDKFRFEGLIYGIVVSGNNKVWLDRNLGASQVATSVIDQSAIGNFYQWGRPSDGHQLYQSAVITGPVSLGNEGSSFVTGTNSSTNYDWLTIQDDTLWGNPKTSRDPCPDGFRIPTSAEWEAETYTWSDRRLDSAFESPLKLVRAYGRNLDGSYPTSGATYYWSSTINGTSAMTLFLSTSINASLYAYRRSVGTPIRCIQE